MNRIIRVDKQGAFNHGIKYPLQDMMDKGITIIKYIYSSYGACYFIKTDYKGKLPDYASDLKVDPDQFKWDEY